MSVIESSWLKWAMLDRNGAYIIGKWRAIRVGRDDLAGFSFGFIPFKPANDQ